MKEIKIGVGSSITNKELGVGIEDTNELSTIEFRVLLAYSEITGWYFPILLDDEGRYLEMMRMTDESTKLMKEFVSEVEHYNGKYKIEVFVDVEQKVWQVDLTK